ncbi:MAG: hypothetical protein Q4D07_09310 [Selenomonadaceae bacterium]|nr:hypothetical protein [Selenomonadaceae bacterium]
MPLMTHAAWEALEAAEAACREGRTADAWDALSRLSVLDPGNLRARFITARLSLSEGALSRAVDLIEDYLSLASSDPDTTRESIREARLMAALLAARVGENKTAERELTACLPLCSEADKLSLSGSLAAVTSPDRNPREYRRASAVFRYQAERVQPYRRYKGNTAGPLRVAYLSEDFFAPDTVDFTRVIAGHDRKKIIPSFYRYAPCHQPGLLRSYRTPAGLSIDIIDLSAYSPQQAAGRIHDDGPDILVTLTGFRPLGASPLAILAYRPAKIQLAGPAGLLLRSPELKCLDYIMGDTMLLGEYEPPAPEEIPDDELPAEQQLRREYYDTLSRAASAADSRDAGESRNKIHLAYSLSDMNAMTDIIELDEEHSEETAEETYSRLSQEEHRQLKKSLEKFSAGITDGISDGLENLGNISRNIGSGFKARLFEGIDHLKGMTEAGASPKTPAVTVPYIKEQDKEPEKLLVLPHTLWAADFPPFLPAPSFPDREQEKISANQSIIADPDLNCLALTDYHTVTRETLALYREILLGHPSVKLAFFHDFPDNNDALRFVKAPLIAAGLPESQLELILSDNGPLPLLQAGAFDILLDDGSAPAAFTAHALAAGLPVVTLDGKPPIGTIRRDREIGRTILRHVWLDEFIATDAESYLNIFDRLAGDHQLRKTLAETLPRTVRDSALGDTAAFLKDLEAAYAFIQERQEDEAAGKVPSIIADHRDRIPETPVEEEPEKKPSFLDGLKGIFSRKN